MKPLFLAVADLHIRDTAPVCRKQDEFMEAQFSKFTQILRITQDHNTSLLVAGDFCHRWTLSCSTLSRLIMTVNKFPLTPIFVIPGQHDLPNHRLSEIEKTALWVLKSACKNFHLLYKNEPYECARNRTIYPFPFGTELKPYKTGSPTINFALAHMMVIESAPLWPGQEAPRGHELLKKFSDYDFIITGDNHKQFISTDHARQSVLINPGSMMRASIDQMDHTPAAFLCSWEGRPVIEKIPLSCRPSAEVISTDHVAPADILETDQRITAFVDRMAARGGFSISFRDNIERVINQPSIDPGVRGKVVDAMEGKNA